MGFATYLANCYGEQIDYIESVKRMMDRWTKEDVLDALQYINDHSQLEFI